MSIVNSPYGELASNSQYVAPLWQPHQQTNYSGNQNAGNVELPKPLMKSSIQFSKKSDSSMFRGQYNGDSCFTLDISDENNLSGAFWVEEQADCLLVKPKAVGSQAVMGITKSGNEKLAHHFSSKGKSDLGINDGIIIGSMSEINKHIANSPSDIIDVIKPLALLPTDYNNAKQKVNLGSEEPSKGGNAAVSLTSSIPKDQSPKQLLLEEAISLLISSFTAQALDQISKIPEVDPDSTGKGKKKSKRKNRLTGVTLVVPSSLSHQQRATLVSAAGVAGLACTGMVSKGLAVVTGALSLSVTANKQPGSGCASSISLLALLEAHILGSSQKGGKSDKKRAKALSVGASGTVLVVLRSSLGAWEVAVVACEVTQRHDQDSDGDGQKNNPFDLVSALATAGTPSPYTIREERSEAADAAELTALVEQAYRTSGVVGKGSFAAVLLGCSYTGAAGLPNNQIKAVIKQWFGSGGGEGAGTGGRDCPPFADAQSQDGARGGCVLTAAQMDSSVLHLRTGEGDWTKLHMLPIGVESAPFDYAIRVRGGVLQRPGGAASPATAASTDVIPVVSSGDRFGLWSPAASTAPSWLSKQESGRVRDSFRISCFSSLGASKKNSAENILAATDAADELSVELLQRRGLAGMGQWVVVDSVRPLAVTDSMGQGSYTLQRTLVLQLDRCTSLLSLSLSTEEKSISDIRRRRWFLLQATLSALVVVVLLGYGLYFLWNYEEIVSLQEAERWITDFYRKNAPEKLEDPQFARKLAKKYAQKMFVLWRSLEKTYNVKWKPPRTILDGSGSEF